MSKKKKDLDIAAMVDDVVIASSEGGIGSSSSTTVTAVSENDDKDVTTEERNLDDDDDDAAAANGDGGIVDVNNGETNDGILSYEEDIDDSAIQRDEMFLREAIKIAGSCGGERGTSSPFPDPVGGALLVTKDDRIIGRGFSTYERECVQACIKDVGLTATPLREWCVSWPSSRQLRNDIAGATLYLTMEPSAERRGSNLPPITQLIIQSGIQRVVIGCQSPIPERATEGAATLHSAGLSVTMGILQQECESLVSNYGALATTKLQRMARRHLAQHGRPLGLLHCSVIDSTDITAFARNGNAFGKDFGGGQLLSERNFGSYEIAPPPESIWANDDSEEDFDDESMMDDLDDSFALDLEDEMSSGSDNEMSRNPMMPWYEQVSAVVATFPRVENIPMQTERMNGLKWLATMGRALPPSVERILVVDASDLGELPVTNDDPRCPPGVDVEGFWKGDGRKKTRVLLRHSANVLASQAAAAASAAAAEAAKAATLAQEAILSSDAEVAAEAALASQNAAETANAFLQKQVQKQLDLREALTSRGVLVENLKGGDPIDVMNHLGERSGYEAVVWRAGCWGGRGVQAIMDGAFQWVSAHLAVDADGGRFWQLMLAEMCVQAACGPEQRVKIFAEDEDISLEYCDDDEADSDCVLRVDGRPVRHVRLDCRVALVNEFRESKLNIHHKTKPVDDFQTLGKGHEEAPWFF